jgi:hypothetical protein
MATAGMIRLSNCAEPIPASSISCLFLAYVFQEVESWLIRHFPN